MTVAATTNRKTYAGDNVTTSFATSPVIFYLSSNLQVRTTIIATGVSTLLTENTHYTVTGGSSAGTVGTVNLAGGSSPHGALLSTEKLVILRVLPLTQGVDLVNNNNSDAEVLESALDKLTDVDQQLSERQDRALTFAEGDVSGSTTTLQDASVRAGRLLGFDALGVLTTLAVQIGTSIVDLAASTGSSLIGFIQAGVGAVMRTLQSKSRDIVCVFDFMTTAQIADVQARTKLVNVAAAIQAAVTAINAASSGELWLPPGTYRIDSEITIPTNVTLSIRGSGREVTIIQLNSTTQNGFNVTSDQAVHFSDFQILGTTSQTAGAGIKINGATNGVTTNPHSSFRNLLFTYNWKGIEFISAGQWRVNGCQFFGILDAGIIVGDSVFPDAGNSKISENMFTGNSASATLDGIRHTAGGGLHVINNSFIQLGCAYRMAWGSATGSSQIRLHGNTVDQSMQVAGFLFDRTAAGSIFGISIKDNYFNTNVVAAPDIWFKTNAAGSVFLVTISGNDHLITVGNTGIQIDGGFDYLVTGELFVGNANGIGIATGNATAASIRLGPNSFENVLTPHSINTATQIRGGQFFGNSNIDFGNVADGAIGTIGTVTVAGAAVGDICTVSAPQLVVGGVLLFATISAANTAKVTAFNKSGGAWNVGAGIVKVFAYRQEV